MTWTCLSGLPFVATEAAKAAEGGARSPAASPRPSKSMASKTAARAVQRGVAVGVATAVAAGTGATAESRAVPHEEDALAIAPRESHVAPVDGGALRAASELVKEELKVQGFNSILSENGSEWLIPTDDWIDATLDLAAEVAADPGVQRTVMEKSRDQALVMRLMNEQPSRARLADNSPLASSFELVHPRPASDEVRSVPSSLSSPLPSPSLSEIMTAENEALKAENVALKAELGAHREVAARVRLQAAVRGLLTRRGYYDDFLTAVRLAPRSASVTVRLVPATDGGQHVVKLSPTVRPSLTLRRPRQPKAASARPRAPPQLNHDGVVITVSVVVGLLALVVMRNPANARLAAAGAAVTVAALLARANQRMAQAEVVPA